MRLIDADKLEPRDISPEAWYSPMWGFELDDIEDAPTVNAVSEEVYTREYNLRKDAEMKAYKLEKAIDDIKAEIEELKPNNPNFKGYYEQNIALNKALEIIDKYTKEGDA